MSASVPPEAVPDQAQNVPGSFAVDNDLVVENQKSEAAAKP